jgi:hypothetical protein
MNSLKIVTTSICKIPPNLPLPKGGITPLWQRGERGDFPMLVSIQFWNFYYKMMDRLILYFIIKKSLSYLLA